MSNINAEQLAKMEEKLFRLKKRREKAAPRSPERAKIQSQVEALEAKMKASYKEGQLPNAPAGMAKGGVAKKGQGGLRNMTKKKFSTCDTCPYPSVCSDKGVCAAETYKKVPMKKGGMVKGYNKGGYVNCGASMKPTQKGTK